MTSTFIKDHRRPLLCLKSNFTRSLKAWKNSKTLTYVVIDNFCHCFLKFLIACRVEFPFTLSCFFLFLSVICMCYVYCIGCTLLIDLPIRNNIFPSCYHAII